jgi:hypothetical protein
MRGRRDQDVPTGKGSSVGGCFSLVGGGGLYFENSTKEFYLYKTISIFMKLLLSLFNQSTVMLAYLMLIKFYEILH